LQFLLAVFALLICQSRKVFGQAEDGRPLAVLKGVDDPKTPLIVLANPITKPTIMESFKLEQDTETTFVPEAETTIPPATDSTVPAEKPTKKTRQPQKQKPSRNHDQKHEFLSMPGGWGSLPINTQEQQSLSINPIFYPMPVYIPYPIPFMFNQQMHMKDNMQDQISFGFNQMVSENLLRGAFKDDNSDWQKNRVKPASQNGFQKWRGKWRKSTSTTTTTT
ncbi:hypothetical protein KR009_001119, partial [Drosophila setifemur]